MPSTPSPVAVHTDQAELHELVAGGQGAEAFEEAFELGDELFATLFNALDGVGGNVGQGQRFTHVPRADLKGTGEWFRHTPARVTGPNSNACNSCHIRPFEDGAGGPDANVHRDTFRTGLVSQLVECNTPHVFAPGAIQRLAEEMTDELQARRVALDNQVCAQGGTRSTTLIAKFTNYGTLRATRTGTNPCRITYNTDAVRGIDFQGSIDNPAAAPDLIVRPFQWGVGSTAPYMHDGRATTITEAILEHATDAANDPSEAAPSRRAFKALSLNDNKALVAFLENLVLFKLEEEEDRRQVATIAPKTEGVTLRVPRGTSKRKVSQTVIARPDVDVEP